jgi:NADH-quinone oxidoreductase subunit E
MKANTTREDGLWSVDGLRCIGACGLAPIITVDGKSYGRLVADDVSAIIEATLATDEEGK